MKRLVFLLFVWATPLQATVYFSSPPNVLVNGTTASAAQVMGDINRIISDGNAAYLLIANEVLGFTPLTLPVGMILPFYTQTCPAGWHEANGAAGTIDLRGTFVRVWNSGGGPYDAGRVRDSYQGDTLQDHTHGLGTSFITFFSTTTQHTSNPGAGDLYYTSIPQTNGQIGGPSIGNGAETRPYNLAWTYCEYGH